MLFHERSAKLATITAVRPPARFGVLESINGEVTHFGEKNQADAGWINGGFFVLSPKVIDMIEGDQTSWEGAPLKKLAAMGEMAAYYSASDLVVMGGSLLPTGGQNLIEAGANLNYKDKSNNTALIYSCSNGFTKIAKLLMK
mgnify:CR=1 FL=1